ncbi:MAG: NAD(P)/FAD-dependent oxidoreductase [Firmicutes bacterium]|nr:NAD(P)/FAD-dependent oxidoreductase [Bacillota bacterium]
MIYDIIVVGSGAAGLMIGSLVSDENVLILEKNSYPGKKLNITGKGRCNLTNAREIDNFIKEVFTNPKFLYSSLREFDNKDLIEYVENLGVMLKEERGQRIFPVSDKARDITNAFYDKSKALYSFNSEVIDIKKNGDLFNVITKKDCYNSRYLILATGGLSYPLTGSTGDGYRFLKDFGHKIIPARPALVGLNSDFKYNNQLMGLSLKNVNVIIKNKNISEFGELLFTHYGFSGPTILRLSPFIDHGDMISIDLKPALDYKQLDDRLLREFDQNPNKDISKILEHLMPKSMIEFFIAKLQFSPNKKSNQISKEERKSIVNQLKNLDFKVDSRRNFNEAVITDGGVDIKEIDPKTMESKIVSNLYVVGELLDVAANTGGFNLQIAFSTAHKAFMSIRRRLIEGN